MDLNIGGTAHYWNFDTNFDWRTLFIGACLVIKGDVTTRAYVTSCTQLSTNNFRFVLEFADSTKTTANWTIDATDSKIYLGIDKKWQWSHQDADDPTVTKLWKDVVLAMQQPYFSYADIAYSSDINPTEKVMTRNLKGSLYSTDYTQWQIMQPDTNLGDKLITANVPREQARSSKILITVEHLRALEFISCYGYFFRANQGGSNIER